MAGDYVMVPREVLDAGCVSITGNIVRFDTETRADAERFFDALSASPTGGE